MDVLNVVTNGIRIAISTIIYIGIKFNKARTKRINTSSYYPLGAAHRRHIYDWITKHQVRQKLVANPRLVVERHALFPHSFASPQAAFNFCVALIINRFEELAVEVLLGRIDINGNGVTTDKFIAVAEATGLIDRLEH